jgi:hypothetical protein
MREVELVMKRIRAQELLVLLIQEMEAMVVVQGTQ